MTVRLPLLLFALLCGGSAQAGPAALEVVDGNGVLALRFTVQEGDRWCLLWNHSVAGFTVRDCFAWTASRLILEDSHQPDFAAGLGHIPGRGEVHSDGEGGYRIEHIDQPIPDNALRLRVGSVAVDHRIEVGSVVHSLSHTLAGRPVVMRVVEQ